MLDELPGDGFKSSHFKRWIKLQPLGERYTNTATKWKQRSCLWIGGMKIFYNQSQAKSNHEKAISYWFESGELVQVKGELFGSISFWSVWMYSQILGLYSFEGLKLPFLPPLPMCKESIWHTLVSIASWESEAQRRLFYSRMIYFLDWELAFWQVFPYVLQPMMWS